jgi:hypothetical protein
MSEQMLADSRLARTVAMLAGQSKTRPDSSPTIETADPQPGAATASAG